MAKQKKVKEERLEDILFECRDNLRGKASIGDKRDLMLTLVFLKFMNDRYDEQVEKVLAEAKGNEKLAKILLARPANFGRYEKSALATRSGSGLGDGRFAIITANRFKGKTKWESTG